VSLLPAIITPETTLFHSIAAHRAHNRCYNFTLVLYMFLKNNLKFQAKIDIGAVCEPELQQSHTVNFPERGCDRLPFCAFSIARPTFCEVPK